jgi:hypothetical protein
MLATDDVVGSQSYWLGKCGGAFMYLNQWALGKGETLEVAAD